MQQPNPYHHGINIRLKLILAHAMTAAAAAALIVGYGFWRGWPFVTWAYWLTVTLGAGLIGALLGLWASARLSRRISRTLAVSQAWLRGNLALRVDPADTNFRSGDDLSALNIQLNLLAEQLEEDEQDLEELRARNMRLTDQVRALAVVEERNRLARELHDSVKQHLFSLSMTAGALRTYLQNVDNVAPELAEMVQEIETAAQSAQHETTRLIEDLRPLRVYEPGNRGAVGETA